MLIIIIVKINFTTESSYNLVNKTDLYKVSFREPYKGGKGLNRLNGTKK